MNNYNLEAIANKTETYYKALDKQDCLGENASYSLGYFATNVINPLEEDRFPQSPVKEAIEEGKNRYFSKHPQKKSQALVLERTRKLSIVPVSEEPSEHRKAGYINILILLYGIINIGMILAIALMK